MSPATQHYILLTAGHVDHGKSALVKALTGTDPDRLPEEKARGITIDLGFAHLQLPASTPTYDLSIIDVPGHEDFVKNMIAGTGAVDLALLVVAADDGWMPQTEEHLQILTYLGVTRAVVALTKSDLLGPEEQARVAAIRERLLGSPFAQAPIIPTSVLSGRGLDELRAALVSLLAKTPPPRDLGKPRLPIDRVFTLPGIGTVVTGTLLGGCLQQGQEVVLQPSGIPTRIRSIQCHNQQIPAALPGMRTALNLADVQPATAATGGAVQRLVRRGDLVTLPGLGAALDRYEVLLQRSPRLSPATARPLKDGSRVRFHSGSGHVAGRLWLCQKKALGSGEACLAQIRFETPVYACLGDHFVLRDWAGQGTLAGGVVLEPGASRKVLRLSPGSEPSLGDPAAVVERFLERHPVLRRAALLVQSNFSGAEIEATLARLNATGKLVLRGDFALATGTWNTLLEQARAQIDQFHQAHPEQTGMTLAQLRTNLLLSLPAPELFDLLVADLLRDGFVQAGPCLKRATHRPALPPQLQAAGARIRSVLARAPLEPPTRKELAPDRPSQEALRFLLQTGEVVELGPDLMVAGATFARLTETLRQCLRQRGSATVSELRQALGASRRLVIPLLEKLDRQGVTRRQGDLRSLKT